jgi:deazaflavin-dependent oxidoreductase (nitroreductase family)
MPRAADRFWKLVTDIGFYKGMGKLHTPLYRLTGGAIGHRTGWVRNLLLTTVGRKSGQPRTVPVTYMSDGDDFVLVASHGGSDKHPAWWLNLEANPSATVQVGRETLAVTAHRAEGDERARLWPMLVEMNPLFGRYETLTARSIPVVVLRRSSR